jgi:hypothetical protein
MIIIDTCEFPIQPNVNEIIMSITTCPKMHNKFTKCFI